MAKLNLVVIVHLFSVNDSLTIDGVMSWAADHGDTEVFVWNDWHGKGDGEEGLPPTAERELQRFQIHGIITDIWNSAALRRLQQLKLPVLDIGGTWPPQEMPAVHVDNAAVGRLGARHLLDKGLQHFGFFGTTGAQHACQRRDAFVAEIKKAGHQCSVLENPMRYDIWDTEVTTMISGWLQSLPRPVGIMCWYDYRAVSVQRICRTLGVTIPEQVAMIGVDDDLMSRLQCPVPLSSIETNFRARGYKAAEVLYRMIRTGQRPPQHVLLPPGNVIERRSSNLLAIDDPDVLAAMRFIQDHANRDISVGDVLRAVPVSRRHLEMQCRKRFGRTPRQQIQHAHVERAKTLMANYDLNLTEIARLSGFRNQGAFFTLFKRLAQCTPGHYRRQLARPHTRPLDPSPAQPPA